MLTSVLGVLLASLGSGPHAVQPDDVCLMKRLCDRPPVYCLAGDAGCEGGGDDAICFTGACVSRGPQLPRRLQP